MDSKSQIVVCIKAVVLDPPKGKMVRTAENSVLNPYDRAALSAAVELAKDLEAQVTALTMGPPTARAVLYEALAMGADKAVLAVDPAMAGSDTLATSRVLSAAIHKIGQEAPVDWTLFGLRSADSDTGQVGPQVAALLNQPLVSNVDRITVEGDGLSIQRRLDGFLETLQVQGPGVLSIHPPTLESPDIELGAIGRVYAGQEVVQWDLTRLGLSADRVGETGSPTCVNSLERKKQQRTCRWIEGEAEQQAQQLLEELDKAGLLE